MTILPKKKTSKEKNEPEAVDHGHGHGHNSQNDNRARASPPGTLPGRSPTSVRDEKVPPHDLGNSYDLHESSSAHNKRRHRSPQHNHRRERKQQRGPGLQTLQASSGNKTDCGCNSEDEYSPPPCPENPEELESRFEKILKEKYGWVIKQMITDGACLFRAVADQVYGDQEMHNVVREDCVNYMAKNMDHFSAYVTEDFSSYLARKRHVQCHGNHIEMQAMAEIYNRVVEVYQYSLKPINTFHGAYHTDNEPVRISYHGSIHYNSIVNPYKATVGVGLGLPEYHPGAADRNLMRDAARISEEGHIEETMLHDKLRETDWELTQDSIMEQVARESYLQWLKDNDKRCKQDRPPHSASATCSTSAESAYHMNTSKNSPKCSKNTSPLSPIPCSSNEKSLPGSPKLDCDPSIYSSSSGAMGGPGFTETVSLMNQLQPNMFGLSDWGDDDVIARVMAQSQQEYLNSFMSSNS